MRGRWFAAHNAKNYYTAKFLLNSLRQMILSASESWENA